MPGRSKNKKKKSRRDDTDSESGSEDSSSAMESTPDSEDERTPKKKTKSRHRSRSTDSKRKSTKSKKKSKSHKKEKSSSEGSDSSDSSFDQEGSGSDSDRTPKKSKKNKKKKKKKVKRGSSDDSDSSDTESGDDSDIKTDSSTNMRIEPMTSPGDASWDFKVGRIKEPLAKSKSTIEKRWIDVGYNDSDMKGVLRMRGVMCTNMPKNEKRRPKIKRAKGKIVRTYLGTHVSIALPKDVIDDVCERLECRPPRSVVVSDRHWYSVNIPREGSQLYMKDKKNRTITLAPSSTKLKKSLVNILADFRLDLWESAPQENQKRKNKKKKKKKKKKKRRGDSSDESSESESEESEDSDSEDEMSWGNFTMAIALVNGSIERLKRSNVDPHIGSQKRGASSFFS